VSVSRYQIWKGKDDSLTFPVLYGDVPVDAVDPEERQGMTLAHEFEWDAEDPAGAIDYAKRWLYENE
jgi:hypothetical protein